MMGIRNVPHEEQDVFPDMCFDIQLDSLWVGSRLGRLPFLLSNTRINKEQITTGSLFFHGAQRLTTRGAY